MKIKRHLRKRKNKVSVVKQHERRKPYFCREVKGMGTMTEVNPSAEETRDSGLNVN